MLIKATENVRVLQLTIILKLNLNYHHGKKKNHTIYRALIQANQIRKEEKDNHVNFHKQNTIKTQEKIAPNLPKDL